MNTFTDFLGKLGQNIASSKLLVTLVTMAAVAGVAYLVGGKDVAVQAIYAIVGSGAVYTGAKTYQNIKLSGNNDTAHTEPVEVPIIAAQIPAATVSPPAPGTVLATSSVTQDQPAAAPIEPNTPFDREAFMAEVEKGIIPHYGVKNACTTLYEAEQVYNKDNFVNPGNWQDARAFMYTLADRAFKEVWGQSYEDALINLNDNPPCTYPNLEYKAMQKGMAQYAILLELKKFQS